MNEFRSGDSAGRGRILRAALHRFAVDGYERSSLRIIALDARASVTLITYHFGSKQRLLDAVDESLRAQFEQAAVAAERSSRTAKLDAFAASIDRLLASQADVRAYLRRMVVVDEAPNGTRLLQSLLTLTRELAGEAPASPADPPWNERALRFLLLAVGPTLVGPALQRCAPEVFRMPTATDSPTPRTGFSGVEKGGNSCAFRTRRPRAPRRRT